MMLFITGCGEEENVNAINVYDAEHSFLNGLVDGQYYVRHKNNTFEPIIFNAATFNYGDKTTGASTNRIMWFRDDFETIPTFDYNKGDTLIYYSSAEITEEYQLERFKDLGISVGICNIRPTVSGKYTVSTSPNDQNTFPNSDADEILKYNNSYLIIDKVQEIDVRDGDNLEINPEERVDYTKTMKITEYGTFDSLKKNAYYDFDIYSGSQKSILKLKADVHILGSCDVIKNINYHFTDDYLVNIEIPQNTVTGYYNINGLGVFRYIGIGDTYTANTDYNKNIFSEEEKKAAAEEEKTFEDELTTTEGSLVVGSDTKSIEEMREEVVDNAETEAFIPKEDIKRQQMDIQNAEGQTIRFMVRLEGSDPFDYENVSALIQHPSGYYINTQKTYEGNLYADVFIDTDGVYTVIVENAGSLVVDVKGEILDYGTENGDVVVTE